MGTAFPGVHDVECNTGLHLGAPLEAGLFVDYSAHTVFLVACKRQARHNAELACLRM